MSCASSSGVSGTRSLYPTTKGGAVLGVLVLVLVLILT